MNKERNKQSVGAPEREIDNSCTKVIRIGGATGYWGESDLAVPQFLAQGNLDYIVFDYLAEVTMSILARARAADSSQGYATDFVSAIVAPHLNAIAAQGIKLISNAGGVNPEACAAAIRQVIEDQGLTLRVAVVTGDDLLPQLDVLAANEPVEMFSGDAFPPREKIASANAYLGAFPIAQALSEGADIVITGRCVDSAVTLAACIHAFGWTQSELDSLAAGSLVGHLIECGPQVTGGNFSDWHEIADSLHEVGYPIAEVSSNGTAIITKPAGTGGVVNRGTVGEQLLYEIADPSAYVLPDVVCDFTAVTIECVGDDRVRVEGARGRGVPNTYKASLTWADGWRAGAIFWYLGQRAAEKARVFADEGIRRARSKLTRWKAPDYEDVVVEVIGDESHWGESARYVRSREVALKVACRHQDKRAVDLLMRELTGAALGAPAGLALFAGTRPKASPVVRLFSILIPKSQVPVSVVSDVGASRWTPDTDLPVVEWPVGSVVTPTPTPTPTPSQERETDGEMTAVPLERLAWARSGDKGDKANIGVMARQKEFLPWIASALSCEYVAGRFVHLMTSPGIDRYYLPGSASLNFVLHNALGGGGIASLRNDPQAKAFAQILLDAPVTIPRSLLGD